jgi:hypothetical protein
MYLTFKNGQPAGTACLVPTGNNMAELGRAASQGRVGNRVIQDMRIIDWLVNHDTSSMYHTIFATCRTAPDRDTGEAKLMRGGQAVSHMWSEMPNLIVGGFGPLYKKHGALETFAYSVLTGQDLTMPSTIWVGNSQDAAFVSAWLANYHLPQPQIVCMDHSTPAADFGFQAEFPPLESGVTELVHGEVKAHGTAATGGTLADCLNQLSEVKSPFFQVPVSLNVNTLGIQKQLRDLGFQAFVFTPGYGDRQPPQLWFGKVNQVPVVERYWDSQAGATNPFWGESLEVHGRRIAANWG